MRDLLLRTWPILLGVVVVAAAVWLFLYRIQTYHLATVEEGVLYRDGNRGVRELSTALRKTNARTVVSLVDDRELVDPEKPEFAEEIKLLQRKGIKLVRIPVKLGGWPSADDVRAFLAIAQDPQNQPVLVHCAQGVRRTGMMVAAYQQAVLKMNDQQVRDAILRFGHSDRSINDVKRFIDIYDPSADELAQLPLSKE